MTKRILGIVGSYRKGGTIDTLVTEVLSAAGAAGAETVKIYLTDQHIEFCRNCRTCTQEAGPEPGKCVLNDDMEPILVRYRDSDAIVLGAPVNFFNVNALTRRFMERLVCFAYWPWGTQGGPKMRIKRRNKKGVLITSSAMPAILGRFFTGALRTLKMTARIMGAKPVTSIFVGLTAGSARPSLPVKALQKARKAGQKLAAG